MKHILLLFIYARFEKENGGIMAWRRLSVRPSVNNLQVLKGNVY